MKYILLTCCILSPILINAMEKKMNLTVDNQYYKPVKIVLPERSNSSVDLKTALTIQSHSQATQQIRDSHIKITIPETGYPTSPFLKINDNDTIIVRLQKKNVIEILKNNVVHTTLKQSFDSSSDTQESWSCW